VIVIRADDIRLPTDETPSIAPELPQLAPILKRIASCESGDRQFNPNGTVLRGVINPHDLGRFQINELIWGARAKELGHDLYSDAGNRAMALWIYAKYGVEPWGWSKFCWSK
jgi:hypothetical protein